MTSQVWGWASHLSEIPLARETRAMVHLNFAQNTFLETFFSTLLGEMGEWSAWGNASTDCGIGSSCITPL